MLHPTGNVCFIFCLLIIKAEVEINEKINKLND